MLNRAKGPAGLCGKGKTIYFGDAGKVRDFTKCS